MSAKRSLRYNRFTEAGPWGPREAIELHLRHEATRLSKSRIELRSLDRPQNAYDIDTRIADEGRVPLSPLIPNARLTTVARA